jgi:hypothetical protein
VQEGVSGDEDSASTCILSRDLGVAGGFYLEHTQLGQTTIEPVAKTSVERELRYVQEP